MTTIEFNKKLICGNDFVAVEIISKGEEQKYGNIVLPSTYFENGKLAFCRVTNVGVHAAEKLGIAEGDYVMIDRLATFAHTAPTAVLKYDSVICRTNKTNTEFFPLKDSVFVKIDDNTGVSNVGGVYVNNYEGKLNTGVITKLGFEASPEYPFTAGMTVMLVKGGDHVSIEDGDIMIYPKTSLICSISEKQ